MDERNFTWKCWKFININVIDVLIFCKIIRQQAKAEFLIYTSHYKSIDSLDVTMCSHTRVRFAHHNILWWTFQLVKLATVAASVVTDYFLTFILFQGFDPVPVWVIIESCCFHFNFLTRVLFLRGLVAENENGLFLLGLCTISVR